MRELKSDGKASITWFCAEKIAASIWMRVPRSAGDNDPARAFPDSIKYQPQHVLNRMNLPQKKHAIAPAERGQ